ncbi:hypothetical protein AAFF_G00233970 [Aldrovandia affinis]|uniref:Uncharacterized protein n=1 Tax=Aldrovandia affinis TaxID=143900 RepID=A0AAD7RF26_9TELE|nr:hypothetical protein AAFF_G00233970 [Aldrovandia affinis]
MGRFCSQVTRGPGGLEGAGLSFAALLDGLSHGQVLPASALGPSGLQENIELNQLTHFLHRDLQQDGHCAESTY